jgi:hypothetical protein
LVSGKIFDRADFQLRASRKHPMGRPIGPSSSKWTTELEPSKHDDMVKAFPLWRANQPFRMSVLPWRVAQLACHKCPWHEAAG